MRRILGSTAWEKGVFEALIGYIERGEIRPVVAKAYPLECIVEAQREFLEKKHVGKLVLVPPPVPVTAKGGEGEGGREKRASSRRSANSEDWNCDDLL